MLSPDPFDNETGICCWSAVKGRCDNCIDWRYKGEGDPIPRVVPCPEIRRNKGGVMEVCEGFMRSITDGETKREIEKIQE